MSEIKFERNYLNAKSFRGYKRLYSRGIGVFIDGFPLGTVWETYNGGSVFDSAWNGSIDGVSIRIERSNPHPIVHLFVKLQ